MKSRILLAILLITLCFPAFLFADLPAVYSKTDDSPAVYPKTDDSPAVYSEADDFSRWPVRIDYFKDNAFITQIPFTYGLPVDVGVGFTYDAPLAGVFAIGEYKRTKKILFSEVTAESRQIKMFLGISSKILFEVKFKHDYFDNVDISAITSKLSSIDSVIRIPLTASYELRAFGSFDSPVFMGKGFAFSKAGPITLDLRGHSNISPEIFENFYEIGMKWQNLNGFGISAGDVLGVFGSIPFENKSDLISNPRFGLGFTTDNWVFLPFLAFHENRSLFGGNFNLDMMLGIPIFGDAKWYIKGSFDFSSGNQLVFDFSQNSFFLGGRMIIHIPKTSW